MFPAFPAYERIRQRVGTALAGGSLKSRVFRGGAWLGAGSFAEQTFRFARNMILARLLAPSAFGTMAVVLSASSVLQALTEIGVRDGLIQNPRGAERQYVDAAWWMAFSRSLLVYILLFASAPFVARFYGNLEITALLRVAVLAVIFEGALSANAYIALKKMEFRKWATLFHGGSICGVVITVVLGFFIRGVWALVIGVCAEGAIRLILSYAICPYLPRLRWDRDAIQELVKFSRGLFGLSLLNLIFSRTDIFVMAKLFSAEQMGLYTMAIFMVQTPAGFILKLMGQVFMPTFSEVQGDAVRTNRILLKITALVMFVGMPVLVFIVICSRPLLTVIYGSRYAGGETALILASCVAIINLFNGQLTGVFYANGQPHLHRRSVTIMAVAMMVTIYPMVKWLGLAGGQLAAVIAIGIGFLLQLERMRKLTGLDLARYGKTFLWASLISASVLLAGAGIRVFSVMARPVPSIALGLAGCLLAYGVTAFMLFRRRDFGETPVAVELVGKSV